MFVGIPTNNVLGSVLKIQKPSPGEAVSTHVTVSTAKDDNILTAAGQMVPRRVPGRGSGRLVCVSGRRSLPGWVTWHWEDFMEEMALEGLVHLDNEETGS